MRPIAQELTTYFQTHRTLFVEFLSDLARMESPSVEPETVIPVLNRLADALTELDYEVLSIPGKQTGGQRFARPRHRKRGRPVQLLLGHCDTVWPSGTLAKMPVTLNNGRLTGPGVFDMKAGVTQIIFALRALRDLNLEPEVTPIVLLTSDEEIGSYESLANIVRLSRLSDRALVLEPALGPAGKIKTARKGVGHFDIIITGRAAHAGLAPEEGASSILELTYIVQQLFALNDPKAGVTVNVGTIDGGVRSNVVAARSRAAVDVRIPTADDAKRLEDAIRSMQSRTPGVTLSIEGGIERMPMEHTPRNRMLWRRYYNLSTRLGITLEEGISGGASDGNYTSRYTATLDGLGAVGDGAHADHEFVDIDRTLERLVLLTLLLLDPPLQSSVPGSQQKRQALVEKRG